MFGCFELMIARGRHLFDHLSGALHLLEGLPYFRLNSMLVKLYLKNSNDSAPGTWKCIHNKKDINIT